MQQPIPERFIVQIVEAPPRGDLYELEQTTHFHVIDTSSGQIILKLRGEMEASLSRDSGLWENYHYSGVSKVTISEDQRTVLVEHFDGTREQIELPDNSDAGNPALSSLPDLAQIDELLAFIPQLEKVGFQPVQDWQINTDPLQFPCPIYHPDVIAFIEAASKPVWSDYDYIPQEAYNILRQPDLVANASLAQIKSLLTYIVRGERFSDGHWAAMIEGGHLHRLLERLAEIRKTL